MAPSVVRGRVDPRVDLGLGDAKPVLLDQAIEAGTRDPEDSGRLTLVATGPAQDPLDVGCLHGVKRFVPGVRDARRIGPRPESRDTQEHVISTDDRTAR